MKFGFASMNPPEGEGPAKLARGLEEYGFESLWVGEHSHIPVERRTPYPAGGDIPPQYLEMMDPFVSLMAAAGETTTLRIGTSVALPLEHDVLDLAKSVATLDRLSDGRFEFGVGVGWNQEELANHRSIPWRARYGALEECVGALRELWTAERSEFHGRFYDFDPVWSLPKPLQRPHPPILCGMAGRLGTQHAVAWADAWMPMDLALGDVTKKLGLFRSAVKDAGRGEVPVTLVAWGDPDVAVLQGYRELGVERIVVGPGRTDWNDPGSVVPFIADFAKVIDSFD